MAPAQRPHRLMRFGQHQAPIFQRRPAGGHTRYRELSSFSAFGTQSRSDRISRLTRIRRSRAVKPLRWRWWREFALIAAFYEAYNFVQHFVTGSTAQAIGNGHTILRLERAVHLDPELALNHAVDNVAALAVPACYLYTTLHFIVTPAVLIWSHYARPRTYARSRAILAVMTLLALAGFLYYPTAPPRLLPTAPYTDTLSRFSGWGWWTSNSLPDGARALENAYAAMPSLHVAWAVWSAGHCFFDLSASKYPGSGHYVSDNYCPRGDGNREPLFGRRRRSARVVVDRVRLGSAHRETRREALFTSERSGPAVIASNV